MNMTPEQRRIFSNLLLDFARAVRAGEEEAFFVNLEPKEDSKGPELEMRQFYGHHLAILADGQAFNE